MAGADRLPVRVRVERNVLLLLDAFSVNGASVTSSPSALTTCHSTVRRSSVLFCPVTKSRLSRMFLDSERLGMSLIWE